MDPRATTVLVEPRLHRRWLRFALERRDFDFANRSRTESSNDWLLSRSHAKSGRSGPIADLSVFIAIAGGLHRKCRPWTAENCQCTAVELTKRVGR